MASSTRPCRITLKSIVNNPEIKEGVTRESIDAAIEKYVDRETLYDQPFVDRNKVRMTGPFTVEAPRPGGEAGGSRA